MVGVAKEGGHFGGEAAHFGPECIEGHFFVLLLMLLDSLEDAAHVELHAANEGHLKDEGAHEVVEHFAAFLLQLH